MKAINLSETMIKKAKLRLEESNYSAQFTFGEHHTSYSIYMSWND